MSDYHASEGCDIRIGALTTDHYDQVVQLWRKAGLSFRPKGRDSKKALEVEVMANPDFFIGAFEDSRLVGVVMASCDGRKGWINRLAVDPDCRRRGIAEALIAEAEKALRKRGVRVFCALIKDSNEASKNLFRKRGYVELEDIKYFSKRDSEED